MAAALNLVLVEDHDMLREALRTHLVGRGHHVQVAPNAEALNDELGGVRPDIYLLDVVLPGEDGLSLARRLRATEPDAGVVLISCLDALSDRVNGYHHGADAYLPKPVAIDELDAVLEAVARRRRPAAFDAPLRLHCHAQRLTGPASSIALSAAEVALLAGLARAPDRMLESWQLIQLLGKPTQHYRKASLEVHLVRLRRKIAETGIEGDSIISLRGIGYRLILPVVLVD